MLTIVKAVCKTDPVMILYVKVFIEKCWKIYRENGNIFLINFLKNSKLALSKFVCGTPMKYVEGRVGLDCFGIPKVFPLELRKRILAKDTMALTVCYTLLSISRLIPCEGVAKISTITGPFTGSDEFVSTFNKWTTSNFTPWLKRRFGLPKLDIPRLLASTKAGPNGLPSVFNVLIDAVTFLQRGPSDIFLNVMNYCKFIPGGYSLITRIIALESKLPDRITRSFPTSCLSKLLNLPDKEGKVRVIAIMDGITQALLKPLHDMVFSILRAIPNDFTHDQRAAVSYIVNIKSELSKKGVIPRFDCFDLSAATDRLPLSVQAPIVGGLLGSSHAGEAWARLISDRDFDYVGTSIRYAVGQPMGAYSSFAMLALTHHAIVQYAWWLTGGSGWCRFYAIVGDDIVIVHPIIAMKYKEIMFSLGVPINELKTFSSTDFFEFCKRYNLGGTDISPLPIALLLQGKLNSVVSFWKEVMNRGFVPLEYHVDTEIYLYLSIPTVTSTDEDIHNFVKLLDTGNSFCPSLDGVNNAVAYFLDAHLTILSDKVRFDVINPFETKFRGISPELVSLSNILMGDPAMHEGLVDSREKSFGEAYRVFGEIRHGFNAVDLISINPLSEFDKTYILNIGSSSDPTVLSIKSKEELVTDSVGYITELKRNSKFGKKRNIYGRFSWAS